MADALGAIDRGLAEQELGDLGGGLGGAEVEFVAVVLSELFGSMPTTRAMSNSGTP
jgi:hypothetical protein